MSLLSSPLPPRSPCRLNSPPKTAASPKRHHRRAPALVRGAASGLVSTAEPCLDNCSPAAPTFLTAADASAATATTAATATKAAEASQPAAAVPTSAVVSGPAAAAVRVTAPPAVAPTAATLERVQVPARWSGEQQRRVHESADRFEARHRDLLRGGHNALRDMARHPCSPREAHAYQAAVVQVQRNRLFVPEKAPRAALPIPSRGASTGGARTAAAAARLQRPWKLEESIWASRPKWADSRSFWDDDAVVERAVLTDWQSVLEESRLLDFLLKHDAATSGVSALAPSAKEAFAKEIEGVLVSHGRLFLSAFDYYASIGTSDDLFHIQSLGYLAWLEECQLVLPGSKAAELSHLQVGDRC